MKLLFFTDTHIKGVNPKSRIDNFYQTLLNKFNEVVEISKEYKVDYILHGGDWFDRPDISPSIVRDFAMILQKFEKPIYTIAGNHDIFGYNPETLSRTMLGLVEGVGIIKVIKYGETIILKNDVTCELLGQAYNFEIDENYEKYYIAKKSSDAQYCINIVHGMLMPKAFIPGVKYTMIDDILDTEADITLVGHYHTGFGVVKKDDKYFVNPGSLVRASAEKGEFKRKPSVVLIELTKNNINIEMIPLKAALPAEEVLNMEYLNDEYDREIKLNDFFNLIDTNSDYEDLKIDIAKVIENIANEQHLDNKVKTNAIEKIEQARQQLNSGDE